MLRERIAPVFGWPKGLSTDNESRFVNDDMAMLLADHNVKHFTGPISQSSSAATKTRLGIFVAAFS